MSTHTAEQASTEPTEDAPILGVVSSAGVEVSAAERWVEDGDHVIRSTEFDVIAGDPDFEVALDKFVDKLENLWIYLSSLQELTDNENETFLELSPRFVAIHRELEERERERQEKERRRRLISIRIGGFRRQRRGAPLHGWQQVQSTQPRSSQPSAV